MPGFIKNFSNNLIRVLDVTNDSSILIMSNFITRYIDNILLNIHDNTKLFLINFAYR